MRGRGGLHWSTGFIFLAIRRMIAVIVMFRRAGSVFVMSAKKIKVVDEWIGRIFSYGPLLIPPSVLAGVSGYISINGDYPPIVILLTSFGVLAVGLALTIWTRPEKSWLVAALLAALSCASIGYFLRFQHNIEDRDRKIKAALFNDYSLEYAGWAPVVSYDANVRVGGPKVSQVIIAATFDNNNEFPIYYKSVRRYGAINGLSSPDQQEATYGQIPARTKDARIADLPIKFDPSIPVRDGLKSNVDFVLCYGRVAGHYPKAFAMKGTLDFLPRSEGGLYNPDFTPADESSESHGAVGCPS